MRKILALILSMILLLTIIPVAYAEDTAYKVGDILQFGSYPQSEVKDEALIAELNALAPEWDEWTSYGYYSCNDEDGSMQQGDWMRYTDVTYNSEKYRGVKFTQYRPYSNTDSFTLQSDNGYYTNNIYWFSFEPIDWQILDPDAGLVLCDYVIDSQPYCNTEYSEKIITDAGIVFEYFNDSSCSNYASDYATSSIREWLNDDFYNTAFTDLEKEKIDTTILSNNGYHTLTGNNGYEHFDSEETEDRIFLLSYDEVINSNYGFNSKSEALDLARRGKGSDYAKNQGLYFYNASSSIYYHNNSHWLLRSPGSSSGDGCFVSLTCLVKDSGSVTITSSGVRPALRFKDISEFEIIIKECKHVNLTFSEVVNATCKDNGYTAGVYCNNCATWISGHEEIPVIEHSYDFEIATTPTCTKPGVKTYTCSCGDSYTETIEKKNHIEVIDKAVAATCTKTGLTEGKHCSECGTVIVAQKTIDMIPHADKSIDGKCDSCGITLIENCSCNCHATGFMGFIWKIINFFNKLFGSNKICACGVVHY